MIAQESLLVPLVRMIDRLPMPAEPEKRGRGRPEVYSDRLFLKALVIMIVRPVVQLRKQSPSLKVFLETIRAVGSFADLQRMLGQ